MSQEYAVYEEEFIERNRIKHIDYIIDVSVYCEVKFNISALKKRLLDLNIDEIYRISSAAEKLFETKKDNETLDKLLDEIKVKGIEEVKNKYLIENEL